MSSHVCLNMIVKNESKILARCLESVAPWISYYVIGDTGSTDGTPDLIRDFFNVRKIEGEIHSFSFENFEQARNQALELCRVSEGNFQHILLTDADMELVVDDPLFRARLTSPVYMVRQVSGISYDNVRLLHRALLPEARYVGLTHEYLHIPGIPPARLDGVWFRDHEEGSSRTEKTERDIRLLKESLEKDPGNARSMFYLAQTLRDKREYRDAIKYYKQRIQAGGFAEEVWYSRYAIAICHRELGNWQDMVWEALTAYQDRPTRAEPLLLLASYYRSKGQNALATLMAETGTRIPRPADSLFVEDHVYGHAFKQELSIAGFYSPHAKDKERARRLCLELATDRSAPEYIRDTAVHNSAFYAVSAKEAFKAEIVSLPFAGNQAEEGYAITNPSIHIGSDGKLTCNLRRVNYKLPSYSTSDGIVRTKNELVFDVRSWLRSDDPAVIGPEKRHPIVDETAGVMAGSQVLGFEDMRIFRWQGEMWASATVRDRNPEMRAEIALLKLEMDLDRVVVRQVYIQRDVHPELHQKNWVPFVDRDQLFFVYQSDPTIILRCDPDTIRCEIHQERAPLFALGNLRGSSQAIAFTLASSHEHTCPASRPIRGWMYVVHEAFVRGDSRQYTHRLVWMNADLEIKYVSDPFYFVSTGIEFCAGLALLGNDVMFSFGVNDSSAHLAIVNVADVAAWITKGQNGYAYSNERPREAGP